MKINRKKFEFLVKRYPNHKLLKIGKDRYLEIKHYKGCFEGLINLLKCIVAIPIGLIWGELEFLWECILEIPMWFKELCKSIVDSLPIGYIKVIDGQDKVLAKFKEEQSWKDKYLD